MTLPSAYEIATTIQQCRYRVPGLQIIVKRACDGAEWIADHCCNSVLISAQLPPDRLLTAIRDATDAIVAENQRTIWLDAGPLPVPRGQDWHDIAG